MSVNLKLQRPNLKNIPFMGSGKKLVKKEIGIGSKVIIRAVSGEDHIVEILENNLNGYLGKIKLGEKIEFIEFSKQQIFLIL